MLYICRLKQCFTLAKYEKNYVCRKYIMKNKLKAKYIFLYRPDSLIENDLFMDFFNSSNISCFCVYKNWNYEIAEKRCLYTKGFFFSPLFSWMRDKCEKDYAFIDILRSNKIAGYKTFIIVCNSSFGYISSATIKDFQRKYDSVFIFLLLDPLFKIGKTERKKAFYIDKKFVYTFEPEDRKKYGFNILQQYYSKFEFPQHICKPQYDVYFCGASKDRLSLIHSVFDYLNGMGVRIDFNILLSKNTACQNLNRKINYLKKYVPYLDVINGINNTKCILDIVQGKQSGVTARYFEAVCYNKKLLTNNPTVKTMPFYNPKYMFVFEKPSDISIDWLLDDSPVDYGYDGRFSPINLLDDIARIYEEQQKEKRE